VRLASQWVGPEEVRKRVAPALEAVAGTLTHLCVVNLYGCTVFNRQREMGYELGVAVGKLRRLKDLALDLCYGGWVYHPFGQGLAASGGDRPLPLLWRVRVAGVHYNGDRLASLALPSVRVFESGLSDVEGAVLTACALRQAGYTHTWAMRCGYNGVTNCPDKICACLRMLRPGCCRFVESGVIVPPPWAMLPTSRLPTLVDDKA
jgi:hypothetical protein